MSRSKRNRPDEVVLGTWAIIGMPAKRHCLAGESIMARLKK